MREGCCEGYFCNPETRRCELCRPLGADCSFEIGLGGSSVQGQTPWFCCGAPTGITCTNGFCVEF